MSAKKQKEKVYFTIPWTRTHTTRVTGTQLRQIGKRLRRVGLIAIGIIVILSIALGSGTLHFAVGTVKCLGLPVQTAELIGGSRTYHLPGDDAYRPNLLRNYTYCTKEQAEAAGYRPVVSSEEARREAQVAREAREEAERFSADKVQYQVYVPFLEGYSTDQLRLGEINGALHTFMRLKKNGTVIGEIRELSVEDGYNICHADDDPKKDYCTTIGTDTEGREIKRTFHKRGGEWVSYYVGVNIGNTGIILASDDDAEAVKILSSLKKYEEQ